MRNARATLGLLCVLSALAVTAAGCSGKNGADGKDGTPGDNGADGATGPKGTNGADGAKGATGAAGPKGDTGATGPMGAMGDPGAMGAMGDAGPSGIIDRTQLTGDYVVYDLSETGGSGVNGIVRFAKFMDDSTLVTVALDGLVAGIHPSHIHNNSAAQGGSPAITLNSIDGITGVSDTVVTTLNDHTTAVTYEDLLNFDGYVNVHKSPMEISTVIAAGDIGQNALTGNKVTYDLMEMATGSGINGTITFEERKDGLSQATIDVTPSTMALANDSPAHMHTGASGATTEIFAFNDVSKTTDMSVSDIRVNTTNDPLTFSDIVMSDAHVMMHVGGTGGNAGNMVATGPIGMNDYDDTSSTPVTVTLNAVGSSGISGTAEIHNVHSIKSGATIDSPVVVVTLSGLTDGATYPVVVNDTTPELVTTLTSVTGDSSGNGASGSAPSNDTDYAALASLSGGKIQVMASPTDSTVVAEGTIP